MRVSVLRAVDSPISLEDVQIAFPLILTLKGRCPGVPEHNVPTLILSTMHLRQYFKHILRLAALRPTSLFSGDRIAGVLFADLKLVRHFRDMTGDIGAILGPAQCYQAEMQQLEILAGIMSATGYDLDIPRPPILIGAFASNQIITYTASLMRDPRATLLGGVPLMAIIPLDLD